MFSLIYHHVVTRLSRLKAALPLVIIVLESLNVIGY